MHLKNEFIDDLMYGLLKDELNKIVFKRVSKITADRCLREKILDVIDKSNGELQLFQFKVAIKYVKLRKEKLEVVINIGDKCWQFFCVVFGFCLLMVFGVICLILSENAAVSDVNKVIIVIGSGVVFVGLSIYCFLQSVPLSVAKQIAPVIKSIED